MKQNKKYGFTLIELLAVIVVITIISLITIAIVTKLIRNSKAKSNILSIENYVEGLKASLKTWEVENPGKSYSEFGFEQIKVDGNKVNCQYQEVTYEGNISLSCCQIEDDKTFYNYIDNDVIKTNNCTKLKEYVFGTLITVNSEEYYVIEDSPSYQDYAVALKKDPLTISDLEEYSNGTNINNFHNYGTEEGSSVSTVDLGENGYGGVPYYQKEECKYNYQDLIWNPSSNCKTEYKDSNVKAIVDNWSKNTFKKSELKPVNKYKARLITMDEILSDNFYYAYQNIEPCISFYLKSKSTPDWFDNSLYNFWTMSKQGDSVMGIWSVDRDGKITPTHVASMSAIRPVINVYKRAIDN